MLSTCIEARSWTVYDMKNAELRELTHQEFKILLETEPMKLTGNFMNINSERVWVDALVNRK